MMLFDFAVAREFVPGVESDMEACLTPGYAPLEQYSGRARFGPALDIYALGATLYHLLTSSVPVPSTERANGVNLDPPLKLNPTISKSTNDAVLWAMKMVASKRPQTVLEFLRALHVESRSSSGESGTDSL
jgi:serine/threonine protein kinase